MEADNFAGGRLSSPSADGPESGFDPHYLGAKKSIDDRALNRYVWTALCQVLPQTTGAEPANIVEIGAGIGTMLARMVDWGLLTGPATYLATDCDAGHIRLARRYLAAWADERSHAVHWPEKQRGRLCTAQAEKEILRRYHASMEARRTGASSTGRRLLSMLQGPGIELLAAGSSDWVVHPRNLTYSGDDVLFLHALIATVEQELAGKSGPGPSGLAAWARTRHRQVEAGALTFLARNLDLLARRRPSLP